MMSDFDEPLFRSGIPEKDAEAFSRQWYAVGGWKLDEPEIMMKVDRTKKKMADLLVAVSRLGSNNVIPAELYSSLFDYLQWITVSTGVHKVSTEAVRDNDAILYVDKSEKIYPNNPVSKKEDWDPLVLSWGMGSKAAECCFVMPSMETVRWLNEVSKYCNEWDEWAKGTHLV